MKSLYPTSSARHRKTKEEGLTYCLKCGFPCRTEPLIAKGGSGGTSRPANQRFPLGSKIGKGITHNQEAFSTLSGSVNEWVPEAGSGCPFCGTYLYDQPNNSKGKL